MSNSIYSNGIARAQFVNLLGEARLKRMIESSPEEALKILSEVNFGDGANCQGPLEFEKILYVEERKLLSFIRSSCSSEAFSDFFLLPYDYHNAEALIKAKHLRIDGEKMLVPHGKYQSSFMAEKISNDDYKFFPKTMERALLECDSLFVNGKATGENVSTVIRKAEYKELYEISKKDKFLSEFFAFKADMQNVSVALRTRSSDAVKNSFITGGNITIGELNTLCTESIETVKEKIKFYANGEVIKSAVKSVEEGLPFSEFERICDGFCLKLLKKEKYSVDGIIPFMLYCYYRQSEIKNVRIIMVGLINGIDKAEIERRLRDCYEG